MTMPLPRQMELEIPMEDLKDRVIRLEDKVAAIAEITARQDERFEHLTAQVQVSEMNVSTKLENGLSTIANQVGAVSQQFATLVGKLDIQDKDVTKLKEGEARRAGQEQVIVALKTELDARVARKAQISKYTVPIVLATGTGLAGKFSGVIWAWLTK